MHVAIPLYPRFTALDAVGPYTVMAFTPGWTVTFVGAETGPVLDDKGGLSLTATATYADLPRPDVVVVPGGPGTLHAVFDEPLLNWVREAHEHTRWTASVCSGSFVLGAAGLLNGREATTHWGWLEQLSGVGATPVERRVVTDGKIWTAAGVSAGIDMALALVAEAAGESTAQTVQLAIEYDPHPPFGAGSPRTAPPELAKPALDLIEFEA
jgi:transcriptional regulator GlxA family with amidase domain